MKLALFRRRSPRQKLSLCRMPDPTAVFFGGRLGDNNRPYSEFYAALAANREYTLVGDPARADLVLELRLFAYGPPTPTSKTAPPDSRPIFRLVIYDAKSHYILWTITRSVGLANFQKTRDKNFEWPDRGPQPIPEGCRQAARRGPLKYSQVRLCRLIRSFC